MYLDSMKVWLSLQGLCAQKDSLPVVAHLECICLLLFDLSVAISLSGLPKVHYAPIDEWRSIAEDERDQVP